MNENMSINLKKNIIGFWLGGLWLLTACSGSVSTYQNTQAADRVEDTGYPAPAISKSTSEIERTGEVQITPTIREELHASDPSKVQLDSGQLQLVEFFAFW